MLVYWLKGLKNDGGISETIEERGFNSDHYLGRFFYDISYFMFINMFFLNIIFGIIVDTFGELRVNNDKLEKYL